MREEAGMTSIDRERGDDITTVKTIEDVRAMKRAHKGAPGNTPVPAGPVCVMREKARRGLN